MSASDSKNAHDLNCLTIAELEALAYERMDKQTRDYYNEGADSGSTLLENIEAYKKYRIRPRVLRDISQIDTSAFIFNTKSSVPFGVAPTAMQCLAHPNGEMATSRACAAYNIPMGLSSFATTTLEEVSSASQTNPLVLQLYLFEDRDHSLKLISRAKAAGYKAVFLTVDTPMLGRRNLEIRNQFTLPSHLKIANFTNADEDTENSQRANSARPGPPKRLPSNSGSTDPSTGKRSAPTGPITFHSHAANPTLSWENSIDWLRRKAAPMEVWVKG